MAKLTQECMALFNDPNVPKVVATVDAQGEINLGPKSSLAAVDEETLAFADIFGSRTRANLEATGKVVLAAFKTTPPFPGYRVKGSFLGFQSQGPLFDRFAQAMKKALNLDIRSVGVIRVEEVYSLSPAQAGKQIA